ncbi:hypothetical protein PFISCL1PPCAC_24716, partial [Pristionchus fissidentatus]
PSSHRRMKADKLEELSNTELRERLKLSEKENAEQREEVLAVARALKSTLGIKNGKIKELEETLTKERSAAKKEMKNLWAEWKGVRIVAASMLIVLMFALLGSAKKISDNQTEMANIKKQLDYEIKTKLEVLRKLEAEKWEETMHTLEEQFDVLRKKLISCNERVNLHKITLASERKTFLEKVVQKNRKIDGLEKELQSNKMDMQNEKNLQTTVQKDKQKLGKDVNTWIRKIILKRYEEVELKRLESLAQESRLYNALPIIIFFFLAAVTLRAINIKKLEEKIKNELKETKKELEKVKMENSELLEEIEALEDEMDCDGSDDSSSESSSSSEDSDDTQSSEDE